MADAVRFGWGGGAGLQDAWVHRPAADDSGEGRARTGGCRSGCGQLAGAPEVDHARELVEQTDEGGEEQGVQGSEHPGTGSACGGLRAQFSGDAGDVAGQGVSF